MPVASKQQKKSFWDMTDAERDADVRQYDKPIPPHKFRPMSAKSKAKWEQVRRNGGPSVSLFISDGKTKVLIDLDEDLLNKVKQYARANKTTLPKMIDRGLRGLLTFEG